MIIHRTTELRAGSESENHARKDAYQPGPGMNDKTTVAMYLCINAFQMFLADYIQV